MGAYEGAETEAENKCCHGVAHFHSNVVTTLQISSLDVFFFPHAVVYKISRLPLVKMNP